MPGISRHHLFPAAMFLLLALGTMTSGCQKSDPPAVKNASVIKVGSGPDALFLTPDERYLYVANVEDSIISVIDTGTDQVTTAIPCIKYPWGFTHLGSSNQVAVSGWQGGIDVIDFNTHQVVRSRRYNSNMGGICSTRDGNLIYVVAASEKKVLEIDALSLEIRDEYPTGGGPDGIGISGDDSHLFVTNTEDGTISVISIQDKSSRLIQTGGKPELVHYNHEHSLLFISNFKENKVHVINTSTGSISQEIDGLDGPEEAVLSPDEQRLYVVNFNLGRVFIYSFPGLQKTETDLITGSKPIGVMPLKTQPKLYVSNYGDNSVSVLHAGS